MKNNNDEYQIQVTKEKLKFSSFLYSAPWSNIHKRLLNKNQKKFGLGESILLLSPGFFSLIPLTLLKITITKFIGTPVKTFFQSFCRCDMRNILKSDLSLRN